LLEWCWHPTLIGFVTGLVPRPSPADVAAATSRFKFIRALLHCGHLVRPTVFGLIFIKNKSIQGKALLLFSRNVNRSVIVLIVYMAHSGDYDRWRHVVALQSRRACVAVFGSPLPRTCLLSLLVFTENQRARRLSFSREQEVAALFLRRRKKRLAGGGGTGRRWRRSCSVLNPAFGG
jgi:hypothetical protein